MLESLRIEAKKLFLLSFVSFCLVKPALSQSVIIDQQNYQDMLAYLMVTPEETELYHQIFSALAKEDFKTADKLSEKLKNDILTGHLLAEKYLSKSYRSNYTELKQWLDKYSDYPQAMRIYKLASRRGPEKALTKPCRGGGFGVYYSEYGWVEDVCSTLSSSQQKILRQKVLNFRRAINRGHTKNARQILEEKHIKRLIGKNNYAVMAASLAMKYFLDNENILALKWAEQAVESAKNATGYWVAGLSAWRMKEYQKSADYFGRLGLIEDTDEWLSSAGAYWAYRANMRLGRKKVAPRWLRIAGRHQRTFYGIVANYKLGNNLNYNWEAEPYLNDFSNYDFVKELLANPAIRRALVLIYAGNTDLAADELRLEFPAMTAKQKEATLYIASQFGMHALAVKISNMLKDSEAGIHYDHAAYPVPDWEPKGGWKVDKALVLALVRQESAFNPDAKSGTGARGLMQLLPSTAAYMAKDRSLRRDRRPLLEVEYNLALGQQYIEYLMQKDHIAGNLFYLATAYNAGPGNLFKWQKSADYDNDPLLFIEVIPSRETRIYIERVMTNFWIYQMRFGEKTTTLEEVATNRWPVLK